MPFVYVYEAVDGYIFVIQKIVFFLSRIYTIVNLWYKKYVFIFFTKDEYRGKEWYDENRF